MVSGAQDNVKVGTLRTAAEPVISLALAGTATPRFDPLEPRLSEGTGHGAGHTSPIWCAVASVSQKGFDMTEPRPPASSGGRVVMLVHGPVGPDSRVTKQARSMSDRGWDVVLLAPRAVDYPVDVGAARIQLVALAPVLKAPRSMFRSTRLRDPLAHTTGAKARYLVRAEEARLGDLWHRVGLGRLESSRSGPLKVQALRARIAVHRVALRWKLFRQTRTKDLIARRKAGVSRVDLLAIAFWTRTMGVRAWRRLWPAVWEQEFAYGPVLDDLAPDIIHANDFMMLAVAARAKVRALASGRRVRIVWDVREYLPGMSPWSLHPRWKPAHIALEKEFAPYADAVLTVSEPLSDLIIADHGLQSRPAVVLNAPVVHEQPPTEKRDVRGACGLPSTTPLIVYSGGAAPQRGLEVMVDALPDLPGVHTAFVVLPPGVVEPGTYVRSLVERAERLGVGDRVHFLNYVPSDEVVPFLSTADLGVFPGLPFLNHTISLITKFLEYSQARLPIVVSNLKTMAETVRETGQGEVFEPEDKASYVAAISRVLADRDRYLHAYDDPERMRAWAWERQAEVQHRVYTDVLATVPRARR